MQKLLEHREKYAEEIRQACRSQVDLWRRIPFLCLQAQGRGGWSDSYHTCIECGLWRLHSSVRHGAYSVSVDCATGELWGFNRKPTVNEIIQLDPKELDAEEIIKSLERDVERDREDHSVVYNKLKPSWRKEKAQELGLSEIYVRAGEMPKLYIGYG